MDTRRAPPVSAALPVADLPWDDLRLFLAVVEVGSINQAASRLGLGQATVSRRLSELEATVGHSLFVRSVAGVTLTPIGEQLVEPVKRMAQWASEVARAAAQGDSRLEGVVRVTAAPVVAATLLVQFAAHLHTVHPGIQLEVLSTARYLDLARGEADLAARAVTERHGDLTSVARVSFANHIYVSRKLAKRLGSNPSPLDVPWLAWSSELDHMVPNPQLRAWLPNFKPSFTADNYLVLIQAAEAGLGAIALSDPIARLLPKTHLVPLEIPLGEHARSEMHIVAAPSALKLPKIRAVADDLATYLRSLGE
jgi:DNA-binding transcriptional LysR family regulator